MQNKENFYSEILREISGGVIYIQKGKILYVNPAAMEILGKKEFELVDKTFAESFFEYSENDDFNQMLLEVVYDSVNKHEKIVPYFNGEAIKHLHMRTSFLKVKSKPLGIIILLDDVTELMKLRGVAIDLEKIKMINRQLSESRDFYKHDAETDKLTGLLNKMTFEKAVCKYLEDLSAEKMSAMFVIDMDNFKKANDTHGHQFGDLILKRFADGLSELFKTAGIVGRFGGDEFVVFLKNILDANFVIEKARAVIKMARELKFGEKEMNLSASVGISIFRGRKNYSEIFTVADKSVYLVKSQGRNGFSVDETAKQSD